MYYINNGIPSSVLPPMPDKQMRNIRGLLPRDTEDSKHLQIVRAKLEEEVKSVYEFGLKKSIGRKQYKTNCHCSFNIVLFRHHKLLSPLQSFQLLFT